MIYIDIQNAILLSDKLYEIDIKYSGILEKEIKTFLKRVSDVEKINARLYEDGIKKVYITDYELQCIAAYI